MTHEAVTFPLQAWESFYVIVGSSAGALTGLQFVVITLVMESRMGANPTTIGAFATPTIVHFCMALLVSAVLSAPWPALFWAGFVVAACGVVGLLYSVLIVWRAMHQTATPDMPPVSAVESQLTVTAVQCSPALVKTGIPV